MKNAKGPVKNIMANFNFSVGDRVNNITKGRACTTYPLNTFNYYNGQVRDNNITDGVVIDITPKYCLLQTLLVENDGRVVCVRFYNFDETVKL